MTVLHQDLAALLHLPEVVLLNHLPLNNLSELEADQHDWKINYLIEALNNLRNNSYRIIRGFSIAINELALHSPKVSGL